MARRADRDDYVNNREFTAAVTEYCNQYKAELNAWRDMTAALPPGAEVPAFEPSPVTEYIATCFQKIANRFARKPNWSGYSYIDDMVSEAVFLCIRYAHNFNPEKSDNAFAYFTQYCYHAFLQVMNKEKKLAKFKFQMVKEESWKVGRSDYNGNVGYDEDNPFNDYTEGSGWDLSDDKDVDGDKGETFEKEHAE